MCVVLNPRNVSTRRRVRRTVRQADRVVQFGDGDGRVDERLDDEVPVVF